MEKGGRQLCEIFRNYCVTCGVKRGTNIEPGIILYNTDIIRPGLNAFTKPKPKLTGPDHVAASPPKTKSR
jgi:hypothetical protein